MVLRICVWGLCIVLGIFVDVGVFLLEVFGFFCWWLVGVFLFVGFGFCCICCGICFV